MKHSTKVKLSLYQNPALASCTPLARFLFPGLKILAGSGRRLKYDLGRIQAELLPYEKIDLRDLDGLIHELLQVGVISVINDGHRIYLEILGIGSRSIDGDQDD